MTFRDSEIKRNRGMKNTITLTLLLLSILCNTLSAQAWQQVDKILAFDGEASDALGYSCDIDGQYAVLGAVQDNHNGVFSGSVYIYKKNANNWTFIQKLTPADGADYDDFGISVAIHGSFIIVGANTDDDKGHDSGSAYIYKNDGSDNFVLETKVTASDGGDYQNFGYSVDVNGTTAIVGAEMATAGTVTYTGAVYVYDRDASGTWNQTAKLTSSSPTSNDNFGYDVAIDGNHIAVGIKGEDDWGSASGAVNFFYKDTGGNWIDKGKKYASDAASGDKFGTAVDLSGNYAIIGAPNDDDGGSASGSAYIFVYNGASWVQIDKLIATDDASMDKFGSSVSISNGNAIVGAFMHDGLDVNAGAAYIYKNDGSDNWIEQAKLNACNGRASDNFGKSVAISGPEVVVGVNGFDELGLTSGAGFFFNEYYNNTCNISSPLPTEPGLYKSQYSQAQGDGWRYFCDCNGKLLLALNTAASFDVAIPDENGVQVRIEETYASHYPQGVGFVSAEGGTVLLDRKWEVFPIVQPSNGEQVGVRFFYTNDEFLAVNNMMNSISPGSTMSSPTELEFYKVTNDSLGHFPAVENVYSSDMIHITYMANSPSTSTWTDGLHGNSIDHFAEYTVTSFSGGGGGSPFMAGNLPVELSDFRGLVKDDFAELTWVTLSEVQNEGFEIQKSIDGENWERIGFVNGYGNSSQVFYYLFKDENLVEGIQYYRLKQLDFDGTYAYSNIIELVNNKEFSLSMYPTVFESGTPLSLEIYTNKSKETSVSIFNINGQEINTKTIHLEKGLNVLELNTQRLQSQQTYVVYIQSGKHTQVEKIYVK